MQRTFRVAIWAWYHIDIEAGNEYEAREKAQEIWASWPSPNAVSSNLHDEYVDEVIYPDEAEDKWLEDCAKEAKVANLTLEAVKEEWPFRRWAEETFGE